MASFVDEEEEFRRLTERAKSLAQPRRMKDLSASSPRAGSPNGNGFLYSPNDTVGLQSPSYLNRTSDPVTTAGISSPRDGIHPFAKKRQELYEQKLRLDFEEQKESLQQRHKSELDRLGRKADKKLAMQEEEYKSIVFRREEEVASLKRKLESQERSFLKEVARKNDELEARSDELKVQNQTIDEKEDVLRNLTRENNDLREKLKQADILLQERETAWADERASLTEDCQNLQAEVENLTSQHQQYVDLAQQILDKKAAMHQNQLQDLINTSNQERVDAVKTLQEEMKKVQQDYEDTITMLESKHSEDQREVQNLNGDVIRLKDLVEELENKMTQQEANHEEWKKQHQIKEADWHTKATLRKLLTEAQEQLQETERKKTNEILQYKKDSELLLRQTRLQCEDEKNKLKTFFAEKKQEYMSECSQKIEQVRHDFEMRYEELRSKEEDLRAKASEFRESMYEKQEQAQRVLQMQKEEQKCEIDKLHKDYTKAMYDQEEKLKLEGDRYAQTLKKEHQSSNMLAEKEIAEREVKCAKLEGTIAALDAAMKGAEDGYKADLDSVLMKLQAVDINYRNAYKKVQGFKVVQEAFRTVLSTKWYSGLRTEMIQRASDLQAGEGSYNTFIDNDIGNMNNIDDLVEGLPSGGGMGYPGQSVRGSVVGIKGAASAYANSAGRRSGGIRK